MENKMIVINIFNKIKEKLKKLFELNCPYCGGTMHVKGLDTQIDKLVYKCEKCGKEWV